MVCPLPVPEDLQYDLIIGKQTMHDLGVKLDFQEKTITIDAILLPMRNIVNLQLKPRITRALREKNCFAQEPISTRNCRRPSRYVPYKGTFVPYDGTYGVPDQGQMLDVCESQTTESALKK